jgi:hypothetical protein
MRSWFVRSVVVSAMGVSAALGSAQSPVAPADVAQFMGTWTLELSSPLGSLPLNLTIRDDGGKVAGELRADLLRPADPALKDITKSGVDLIVKYAGDAQGVSVPVELTLTLDGSDKLRVKCDIMNGQFMMDGTGTKK